MEAANEAGALLLTPEQQEAVVTKFMQNARTKVYLTRGGVLCIIFTHEGGGEAPLIGVYYSGNDEWVSCRWMADGKFPSMNPALIKSKLDLLLPKDPTRAPREPVYA